MRPNGGFVQAQARVDPSAMSVCYNGTGARSSYLLAMQDHKPSACDNPSGPLLSSTHGSTAKPPAAASQRPPMHGGAADTFRALSTFRTLAHACGPNQHASAFGLDTMALPSMHMQSTGLLMLLSCCCSAVLLSHLEADGARPGYL